MAHTDEKKDLEAGSRLSGIDIDEKAGLRNSAVQNPGSARSARLKVPEFIRSSTSTMPSFRHFLIYLTIFAVFAVTFTSAATVRVRNHHAPTEDEIQFKKLLATISDPALHDALEQYISSRYHPSAGGQENTAVQVDNAAVATSLAELVRRQSTNGTTTTTTTSITDPPDTTSSIVEPPTTSDAPPTTTSDTPTRTTPPPTTETPEPTNSSTESPPPTSTPAPTTPTSTPPSSTPTEDGPTTPSPTKGTETKTHTSKTQATTYTTVGPDGTVSTVTAYTVVPASEPTQDTPEPTYTPSLQGAASRFGVVGTLGYGLVLFIGLAALL